MRQAMTIPTELQNPYKFEQDALVFWQDPFASDGGDRSGVRVVVYSPSSDDVSEAIYHVSDLNNEILEAHHHELRPISDDERQAWFDLARQYCKLPFEQGDIVIWDDPASNEENKSLYRVMVAPDVSNFTPDELLIWSELMSEQEFLIRSPDGSEAGVYPHEIRKATDEEISAYFVQNGGERCPFCFQDSVEGGSVTITTGAAHQEVSCYECDGEWTAIYTLTECGILR